MRLTKTVQFLSELGIELTGRSGDQYTGDCPLCDKEEHFYVNKDNAMWDCKSCGESGNRITLLTRMTEEHKGLSGTVLKRIATSWELPPEAFEDWDVCYINSEYMFPVYSPEGTVRDFRRWKRGRQGVRSLSGANTFLMGMQRHGDGKPVVLCEGEKDAVALHHSIGDEVCVLAVPGASTWKDGWPELFKRNQVVIAYDNDDPGRHGRDKVAATLPGSVAVIWPEGTPDKYDVRDWLGDGHSFYDLETTQVGSDAFIDKGGEVSYDEMLERCEPYLVMHKDMRDALAIGVAVAATVDVQGPPLWIHFVGVPSSGKTEIISMMRESEYAYFQDSFTPSSLISGWKAGEDDPSLLAKANNTCLAIKDFTEILSQPAAVRAAVSSTLRGAYDGTVARDFGNGVERHYDVRMNIISGVTYEIEKLDASQLGERFLRFAFNQLDDKTSMSVARKSMEVIDDAKRKDVLCQNMNALIRKARNTPPPVLSDDDIDFVYRVARFVTLNRVNVEIDNYTKDLVAIPRPEEPTRISRQLAKLIKGLCMTLDMEPDDDYIRELVFRVAASTCGNGRPSKIMHAVYDGYCTRDSIADTTGLHKEMVRIYARSMEYSVPPFLTSVSKNGKLKGRPQTVWQLSDFAKGIFDGVYDDGNE